MRITPDLRQRLAWWVIGTFLAAALWPSMARLMPQTSHQWVEICTTMGVRLVDVADTAETPSGTAKGSMWSDMSSCPFCTLHHGAPALPPPPALVMAVLNHLSEYRPPLFLHAPRPLHAWASAQPRAPPLA